MALDPKLAALREVVKGKLAVDSTGKCVPEDGLFEAHGLPAGGTVAVAEEYRDAANLFAAAVHLGFGENVIDAMKANPAINAVEAVIPTLGKDSIKLHVTRKSEERVPDSAGGGMKTVYGQNNIGFTHYHDSGSRGLIKQARTEIKEYAAQQLVD